LSDATDVREFVINGKTYPLLGVETLTFAESRKLKRLSGGMSSVVLGEALGEGDSEAIFAILTVSAQRVNPKLPDDFLDDCNFAEVIGTISGEDDEDEEKPERPTALPGSAESTSGD
jgi:hypothetical protein